MIVYLTSVFKVMYATKRDTQQILQVTPDELAAVTATQCFQDADTNADGL